MINIYCIRPKGFNIGNDVIHLALIHFIRNAFREDVNIISLPATGKYETQKKAGLNSQTVYEINQFGDGLIIGGGNLYENGELEINPTALKALEVPMMIISVSRGKIYNKDLVLVDRTDVMTDDNIVRINKKADLSLSRDIITQKYIKDLGIQTILGGCPTLFLNEIPQHMVPLNQENKSDVLISIRTPTLMSVPASYQYQVRDQIRQMTYLLKDNGYNNIKILCHDHRDIPFATSFKDIEYIYTDDVYTFLSYLKSTKLNITYRLHSFLPGLAFDVPVINISYDQRSISLLDTVGMNEWNINMLHQDPVAEVGKRIKSLGDLESIKSSLRIEKWPQLREVIVTNIEKFTHLVLDNSTK